MGDFKKIYSTTIKVFGILILLFAGACHKNKADVADVEVSVDLPEKIEFSPSGSIPKPPLKKEVKKQDTSEKNSSFSVIVNPTPKVPPKKQMSENKPKQEVVFRDPFFSFLNWIEEKELHQNNAEALLDFDVQSYKYVGIITGSGLPLALVEDPSGIGYTLKEGDLIGRNKGRVHAIYQNKIIVKEVHHDASGKEAVKYVTIDFGQ